MTLDANRNVAVTARSGESSSFQRSTIEEKDLGQRLASDAQRMNEERARRGLPPR